MIMAIPSSYASLVAKNNHRGGVFGEIAHFFLIFRDFLNFSQNNSDFSSDLFRFLEKICLKISEKRNLNVLTSKLDSESLSTLRKIFLSVIRVSFLWI